METKIIEKENYPKLLKQISALPKELSYKGIMPSDENKFLCIVGARNHSEYGRDVCEKLIAGLKKYPIVIVSGLALGIDSIAHRVALENKIKTIAFPGSGLHESVLYPYCHQELAGKILDSGGALISQFHSLQPGAYWTFPSRNRLMAGISHATLIIEAKKGSGTLLTGHYATEFNRDVMAVPGSIFNELSYGPHMLISKGATPVFSSEDILTVLGFIDPNKRVENPSQMSFGNFDLSQEEQIVLDELRIQNMEGSLLAMRTGLPPAVLNTTLSKLEIKGVITESGGIYKISIFKT